MLFELEIIQNVLHLLAITRWLLQRWYLLEMQLLSEYADWSLHLHNIAYFTIFAKEMLNHFLGNNQINRGAYCNDIGIESPCLLLFLGIYRLIDIEFDQSKSKNSIWYKKMIFQIYFHNIPTQILSSWPSLLYIHGPMGIFNIRSQNFWVNQNEKCENIFSIRTTRCFQYQKENFNAAK